MSHGNTAFVRQLLQVFTEDAGAALAQMETGIAEKDYAVIRSQTHNLTPNLDLLKINKALQVCKELNARANKKADMDEINALFVKLKNLLQPVMNQIKEDIA